MAGASVAATRDGLDLTVPVFAVSSVTGEGLMTLHAFLSALPPSNGQPSGRLPHMRDIAHLPKAPALDDTATRGGVQAQGLSMCSAGEAANLKGPEGCRPPSHPARLPGLQDGKGAVSNEEAGLSSSWELTEPVLAREAFGGTLEQAGTSDHVPHVHFQVGLHGFHGIR